VVIDTLEAKIEGHGTPIGYFYFDYNSQQKQSVAVVLRCLLKQFLSALPSLPVEISLLYEDLFTRGKSPDQNQILSALLLVAESSLESFVILDALDECQEGELVQILDNIQRLVDRCDKSTMKIFATSRPHLSQINRLSNDDRLSVISIEVVADPTDVETYLTKRLDHVSMHPQLKTTILEKMTTKADGV